MIIENNLSNIDEKISDNNPDLTLKIAIIRRLLAFLVDNIFLILFSITVFIITNVNLFIILNDITGFSILILSTFLFHQIYFLVFEFIWKGKTIGKSIFKIKVINIKGSAPDFITSLVRNFSRAIYLLPPFFFVPDLICLFLTAFKKRIGDVLAVTLVVKL